MEQFVALDVETANSDRGSVCAVGLSFVKRGRVSRTETWLVRPPKGIDHFDWRNTKIHGIDGDDVRRCPRIDDVWAEISIHLHGSLVIAHNAGFDVSAVRATAARIKQPVPEFDYLCTMVMARRVLLLDGYRLPVVASALGVPLVQHHEAGSDAQAAAGIALALMSRCETKTLKALATYLGVSVGVAGEGPVRGCQARR